MRKLIFGFVGLMVLVSLFVTSPSKVTAKPCQNGNSRNCVTPTPVPTNTPTPLPTSTPIPTPTITPSPTATPSPTPIGTSSAQLK